MSTREAEAAATLARLGLDPAAAAAGRVTAAEVAPRLAGADGAALVAALGDLATPGAGALLVALEAGAPGREVRKAIRRALYRLRQRGVPLPEPPPAAPAAARAVADASIEGFVTPVDGRGDRLVWLVRALPAGGVLLVAAQVNEPAGLEDVQVAEVSRRQLRQARQELERQAGVRLVPAEWRRLDALVVEAHGRVADAARDRARDYLRVRPRLTADAPAAPAEPVSARVPAPADHEVEALVAGSAELLAEPELRSWWPPADATAAVVQQIASLEESPLVVSRAAQEDRLRELLGRAATDLVPPAVFARRLDAVAYVLAESGRSQAARRALAVARALRERPDQAAAVPLVVAYVERAVAARLAEASSRRSEERRGALVVTPGEYLKARSSSRPPHTRG